MFILLSLFSGLCRYKSTKSHYEVLGVPRKASEKQIKDAFKKLSIQVTSFSRPVTSQQSFIIKSHCLCILIFIFFQIYTFMHTWHIIITDVSLLNQVNISFWCRCPSWVDVLLILNSSSPLCLCMHTDVALTSCMLKLITCFRLNEFFPHYILEELNFNLRYVRLRGFDIPSKKWINYLQTVETLIILWSLIWVFTICQLHFWGSPVLNGLNH